MTHKPDNIKAMEIDGEIIIAIAKSRRLNHYLKDIGVEQGLPDQTDEIIGHLNNISNLHHCQLKQQDNNCSIRVTLGFADEINPILRQLLQKVNKMSESVTALQNSLDEINAQVAAQGEVLLKVAVETETTLASVVALETQVEELKKQLEGVDVVIPQEIFDTIASIKGGIESNQAELASIDALVPDAP
jgi:hypothetical protein